MTSTTNTRPALAMITPARRPAAATQGRRPRPTSPAHQALEARLVGCFG